MVNTKPANVVVEKWLRKATAASEDYKMGVENPRRDWQSAALAAAEVWKTAIQQAAAKGLWEKGIQSVSTEEWKRKAVEVGAARYSGGVSAAKDAYAKKIAKVLEILKAVDLPPRGPRGDPRNYERVKAIGDALHAAKEAGSL